MQSKTEKIKQALIDGDVNLAISTASKFFDRGDDTKLFQQAKSAIENPGFYRQIGKSPEGIITRAKDRLIERFA